MQHFTRIALLGLFGLVACNTSVSERHDSPDDVGEHLPPTTSGAIALSNLDFRIESTERLLAASDDQDMKSELIALLSQRARFRGSFEDYDRAEDMSTALLASAPEDEAAMFSRASVLGALHRFDEAHALLDQIEGAEDRVLAARLPMLIASATPGPWVERARARAEGAPSFASFVALGSAHAARGDFEDADRAFLDAAAAYRDVSPFAIAWLQFQRGVMWSERAGDSERGRRLYEDAVARLPLYVTANVHLAEIEREENPEVAIERLRGIVDQTSDPEPMGLLGELLLETGREQEGRSYVEAARRAYESLLGRHRAAFADHAAEFNLGPGENPEAAFELARSNLELRPTERAYSLAIRAALASGRNEAACNYAREAERRQPTGVELTSDLPLGLAACR